MDEPDLDQPGKPLTAWAVQDDGTKVPFEIPQTLRNNLQDIGTRYGDCEKVTRQVVEEAGFDWRTWKYFVLEQVEHQRWTDEHMASYEANYEAMYGEPAPGMAELRARMRKDRFGLTHLDPEPADDE
jgi:hypothetical protein